MLFIAFTVGADNPNVKDILLGRGIGAAAGVATGKAVFTTADAEECARKGETCILCRTDVAAGDVRALTVWALVVGCDMSR